RPVEDLAARVADATGDAGAVVEELRQGREVGDALARRPAVDTRDRLEGRDVDGWQLAREGDRLERVVGLEREGLGRPVERVRVGAEAGRGVTGPVVKGADDAPVAVAHGTGRQTSVAPRGRRVRYRRRARPPRGREGREWSWWFPSSLRRGRSSGPVPASC